MMLKSIIPMKKLFLTAVITLILAFAGFAENYPYRSDMLWVTVPDHADWLYRSGESPSIEVQLYRYGVPVDATVEWEAGPDLLASDAKGTVSLKNGKAVIKPGTMKKPGFRDIRLKADIDGKEYTHHVKIGFDADKIRPFTALPDDFDSFWQKNLDEIKDLPLTYSIEPSAQYTTDKADAFLVKLQTDKKRHSIYGYLFIPKGAKPGSCPVVLCPPGAGVKTIKEPLRHRYYHDDGMIRFETEIHGLNPEMEKEEFDEASRAFGDYLQWGLDDRDNYYMKHVYQGMVRAIDFLTSLPEWDGRNVAVQGGSQGGALAIVTAALDPRVTLCVANHPALSDMAGYKAGTGGYPHFNRMNNMLTDDKTRTMAYYDVVNFARRLRCPVRMTWGYNDNTCPPTTSWAVWNVITAPKESLLTPINEHWTSEATERSHKEWIKARLIK